MLAPMASRSSGADGFDGGVRADWHEDRRADDAVRRADDARASARIGAAADDAKVQRLPGAQQWRVILRLTDGWSMQNPDECPATLSTALARDPGQQEW